MALTQQTQMMKTVNLDLTLPAMPKGGVTLQEYQKSMLEWWERVQEILQRQNEQIESAINAVYDAYKKTST